MTADPRMLSEPALQIVQAYYAARIAIDAAMGIEHLLTGPQWHGAVVGRCGYVLAKRGLVKAGGGHCDGADLLIVMIITIRK